MQLSSSKLIIVKYHKIRSAIKLWELLLVYKWIIDKKRVCLIDSLGNFAHLTAQEIFLCAFNNVKKIGEIQLDENPIDALPNLSFSRYPAEIAIKLSGSPPLPLDVTLGYILDQTFTEENYENEADQIIVFNKWYPIDLNLNKDATEWLKGIGIFKSGRLSIGQLISLRGANNPPVAILDNISIAPNDIATKAGKEFKAIVGLNADLYPYQRDGVAFLELIANEGVGCVLADEMGLGKTLQVIALLLYEKNANRIPSIVIAPATLLENWKRELKLFAPDLKCLVHSGASRVGFYKPFLNYDIVITSYDTAIRDELLLSSLRWNVLALDEAQAIKNPDALRTLAVKRIPRRVSVAITGTPVENSLSDLWSISDFVLPGLLGSINSFKSEFSNQIDHANRLSSIVAPLLLRRKVEDVAKDLPAKIEIPQPILMSNTMAELYEEVRKNTLEEYGPSAGIVAATKLRVLCTHPRLDNTWPLNPCHEMPKYERLIEILTEIFNSNQKAILFTSFQAMVDLLMEDMPTRWPDGFFQFIDGRISTDLRQDTVDNFFAHKGYGVLFLNPKAAGTGLNITTANHVIHYNPEWNPALTAQASARAYRRKQNRPVTIHYLYFVDSIEEVIMERADFKRELAAGAVIGHEGEVDPSTMLRALEISPLSNLEGNI